MTVRQIRDVAPSPDGKRLAFTALDRVWTMDLPNGTPSVSRRTRTSGEFQPAWSPDGQYIAYVTWNDVDGGTVSRMRADGSGRPEKLSGKPAYYEKPAYSHDGRRIVVGRGPRNMRKDLRGARASAAGRRSASSWCGCPARGGAETVIAPISNFGRPHFVRGDSTHVYFAEGSSLVSMRWDGTDQKTILRSGGGGGRGGGGGGGGGGEMMMSPDGNKVLVQVTDQGGPRAYLVEEVPKAPNGADDQRDESGAVGSAGAQAHDDRRRVRLVGRRQPAHLLRARPLAVHVRSRRGRRGGARLAGAGRGAR